MSSVGVPLPPPFKGQNDQLPAFSLENPFCVRMQNLNNDRGIVSLRKGNKKFAQVTANAPRALAIASYGDKLFMVVDDSTAYARFYDITTGTPSSVYVTPNDGFGDRAVETLYFNNYLFFFGDGGIAGGGLIPASDGPVYYNGSAWGKATWTYTGSAKPFGGAVYKNRAYLLDWGTADYFYTNIDAISGVTTRVSLATIISEKAELFAIKSVSLSENVTQENLIAFILSSGEILIYSGSYPNSESWRIVSRLKTAPPLYYNSTIDAKGDTFLLTRTEILSLRNLIAKGYDAERREGIGAAIESRYKQIIQALTGSSGTTPFTRGVYDKKNDRLIVSFGFYVDPSVAPGVVGTGQVGFFQLIYDFGLGAWYEYYQLTPDTTEWTNIDITEFKDGVYVLTKGSKGANVYATAHLIEGQTGYLDDNIVSDTQGVPYKLTSAPHPLNRYGVVKTDGLEVIMKSDIYSTAKWRLIGDLGAQQTAEQVTSGNGSNVTKTFVNLGIESNLVQYELSGTSTTSTVGLEVYGTNLWVNPSQGVAR